MKTNQPLIFDDNVQTADCYLFKLADGTAILITNCDRPLTAPTAIEWSTVEQVRRQRDRSVFLPSHPAPRDEPEKRSAAERIGPDHRRQL